MQYFQLKRDLPLPNPEIPMAFKIRPYSATEDHALIPKLYAASFTEEAWTDAWDNFPLFDPNGVFIAVDRKTEAPIGFVISFARGRGGYISVVAVLPEYQRMGVARSLVQSACTYLTARGFEEVTIDVDAPNVQALQLYRKLGFFVTETRAAGNC